MVISRLVVGGIKRPEAYAKIGNSRSPSVTVTVTDMPIGATL
jgi:hypothetical protein